jgi:hypothetical protein
MGRHFKLLVQRKFFTGGWIIGCSTDAVMFCKLFKCFSVMNFGRYNWEQPVCRTICNKRDQPLCRTIYEIARGWGDKLTSSLQPLKPMTVDDIYVVQPVQKLLDTPSYLFWFWRNNTKPSSFILCIHIPYFVHCTLNWAKKIKELCYRSEIKLYRHRRYWEETFWIICVK